jgi:PIN domain nuclease of toxin-antitoxin system
LSDFVADTHALFWYLTGSDRLGHAAKSTFDAASRGECIIHIPVIVLAELHFVIEKAGRVLDFGIEM